MGEERILTMGKKKTRVLLASGLAIIMVLAMSAGAFGATGKKSLSALFKNIKLNINGKVLQSSEEPFIVNGRTYVPLRVVGEALGAWVDWNANTNVVTISGTSGTKALEEQLQQKDIQIAQLQLQVEDLQAKLNNSNSNNSSNNSSDDEDIDDLEKDLKDDYKKLEDVAIDDISLSGDKDKVTVTIDVDLDDDEDEWKDLSNSDIKSWVSKICDDIQDYYDDDTDIDGKIKDIDSKDTLVTFSKDGSKSLSISYKDDDYRKSSSGSGDASISDVERDLKGKEYTIEGIDFEIDDIDYNTSRDEINVVLKATEDDADEIDDDDLEDGAKDICKDIADEFIDEADADPETVYIEIYDNENGSLDDFEYDVADKMIK